MTEIKNKLVKLLSFGFVLCLSTKDEQYVNSNVHLNK